MTWFLRMLRTHNTKIHRGCGLRKQLVSCPSTQLYILHPPTVPNQLLCIVMCCGSSNVKLWELLIVKDNKRLLTHCHEHDKNWI